MPAPKVTIGILSWNRPIFLAETIKALYRWPGMEFELIVYSNASDKECYEVEKKLAKKYHFRLIRSKENIGFRAIPIMLKKAKGKYYVWYEDDFLWVERNWLKKLVTAFENSPTMQSPWHSEWGIIACTSIIDRLTSGAMWLSHFDGAKSLIINGISYIASQTACGSPFIFNKKLALQFDEFQEETLNSVSTKSINFLTKYNLIEVPIFGTYDAIANSAFTTRKYPVAHVAIKCYHANGPFYNSLYEEITRSKQSGDFWVDAANYFKHGKNDGYQFNFEGMGWVLELLKQGKFNKYVDKLLGGL
jgi:glycosyltransferase involved in cell wall biosynthesis